MDKLYRGTIIPKYTDTGKQYDFIFEEMKIVKRDEEIITHEDTQYGHRMEYVAKYLDQEQNLDYVAYGACRITSLNKEFVVDWLNTKKKEKIAEQQKDLNDTIKRYKQNIEELKATQIIEKIY